MSEAAAAVVGYVAVGWAVGWAMFKWAEPPSVKGLPNGDRACTFCIVLAVWPLVILFALACAALED